MSAAKVYFLLTYLHTWHSGKLARDNVHLPEWSLHRTIDNPHPLFPTTPNDTQTLNSIKKMKAYFSPKSSKSSSSNSTPNSTLDDPGHTRIDIDAESVEVNCNTDVLPLHAQDALRLYGDHQTTPNAQRYRSSSCDSLQQAMDQAEAEASISTPSSIETGPADELSSSQDKQSSDTGKQTQLLVVAANEDSFELATAQEAEAIFAESKRHQKLKRMYTFGAALFFLLLFIGVLVGVLAGGGGDDDLGPGGGSNQVVVDIDNPNDFPPTPFPSSTGDAPSDLPYLPPGHTDNINNNNNNDDHTNYCPTMKGATIQNFTQPIRLVGRVDNTTLTIGANNNPNATQNDEIEHLLPPCQDNSVYGRGQWFLVQGPGAVVRASTCQSMGLVWEDSSSALNGLPLDTQLSVFTSQTHTCSDGLECVTGNDDASCGSQSIVSWYAEKDRFYYIFVSGKPTPTQQGATIASSDGTSKPALIYPSGNFGLTLSLAPVGTCDAAIDYESKATAVTRLVLDPNQQAQVPKESSEIVGTLLGAKIDLDPCVPGQWLGRGGEIWYRVNGTGRWIMASTCAGTASNEFPPRLALYRGQCDRLQCALSKASEFAPSVDRDCGFGYSLNWWASLGEEYYIMVYKTNFLPGIQFGLTVEDLNPPTNDNCTDAIELYADGTTTYGSTLRATYSPQQIAPTCMSLPDEVTHSHPGVWYRVLGTGTRLTASLCDVVTEFDTKISVYQGSCGNLQCVTANDQWCGYQSSVYWESTQGTMYYLLVHGSTGGTSASMGDFGLTVFEFKPSSNDYCTDAIWVQPGSVTEGSTSTASADDYIDSCDFTGGAASHRNNQAPGVWYKVFGTGGGMRAHTCGGETTYDTRISIYQGSDCQELSCVVSDDNGCGFQSSAYWFSKEGETYYILVTGNLFSSFGDFVLRVEDYQPNTINDFCANAISASTTTVNLGSTRSATFDGVETCVVSNTSPGIWYKVKGSGTGMVASTCHIVTDFDTRISVFRGSECKALECVAGNDDSHQSSDCGSSAGSRVSWLSQLGEDYHILVHGWGALVGTFGLTIEEVVPLVANDFCITSSPVEVAGGSNPGSQPLRTLGVTIDATVDNVPVCGDVESIGHGVWYKGVGTGNRLMASTCNDFLDESDFAPLSTAMPGVVTDFDTQISVFRGGCRALECLGANNDRCGLQSSVNFFVEDGEPFYVLVHGSADSKGSFGLLINEIFPQVENDFCDVATRFPIAPGGLTNQLLGSTAEASYDTVNECVVKNTAPGVWYQTTGTGNMVTVTTCGGQTDFDTRLSVYTGSCAALECVTGNDDTSRDTASCGLASTASWQSIEGQIYYIRVHGWGSLTGNFQLSIYEIEAPQ